MTSILFIKSISYFDPNLALIYPKSHVECRESTFDRQINDENSKAAFEMNLGFDCRNG